jgi:tetratricopeptide (TPR) repeat protein
MARTKIGWLLMCWLLLGVAAGAGGCDKNKQAEEKREKEIAARQKGEAAANSNEKFEKSDDPPFTADTRFAAGQLAEAQGNLENAITQYKAALKLNPKHLDAMFRLGWVDVQARQYDEAIATWQRYLKATNNSAQGYNNLALAYEAAGRFDDAEQTYKAAIARDPQFQGSRLNYGLMLARRGQVDPAIAQLSAVLPPAAVHYNLGSICEQQGRTEEAKAYYRKALELDPKLHDARAKLAALK